MGKPSPKAKSSGSKPAPKAKSSGSKPAPKVRSKFMSNCKVSANTQKKPATGFVQSSQAGMSLEDKLQLWRSKNNVNEDLGLDHEEQKKLSSKFLNALKTAPSEAQSVYSDTASLASGLKNKTKQSIVKAWLLDNKWGDNFLSFTKSINFSQDSKKIEKPITRMELESKYSEEEINDLLESNGITEVSHKGSSRVKLYVDHGMWEKSKTLTKSRNLGRTMEKKEDDDDALEDWDRGFNSSIDVDKAEDLFMKDCASLKPKPVDDDKEKPKKPSLKDLQGLDHDSATKLCQQASTVLNNRTDNLEALLYSLKKNDHYSSALKKTSDKMLAKMKGLLDQSKLYVTRGGSFDMMLKHLKDVPEVLKDVQQHVLLLKRL